MFNSVLHTNGLCVAYHTFATLMFYVVSRPEKASGKRNMFKTKEFETRAQWLGWECRLSSDELNFIMDEVLDDLAKLGKTGMMNNANWILNKSTQILKHS